MQKNFCNSLFLYFPFSFSKNTECNSINLLLTYILTTQSEFLRLLTLTSLHYVPLKCTGFLHFDWSSLILNGFFPPHLVYTYLQSFNALNCQSYHDHTRLPHSNYIPQAQNSLQLCNDRFTHVRILFRQFYMYVWINVCIKAIL